MTKSYATGLNNQILVMCVHSVKLHTYEILVVRQAIYIPVYRRPHYRHSRIHQR